MQIPSRTVQLTIKSGVDARDYDEVAKKENLKPLEVELRKVEDAAARIMDDMLYFKNRGMLTSSFLTSSPRHHAYVIMLTSSFFFLPPSSSP